MNKAGCEPILKELELRRELFDEVWPADFFDDDEDEQAPRQEPMEMLPAPQTCLTLAAGSQVGGSNNGKTRFADLPSDIIRLIVEPLNLIERTQAMRCSRAMLEAVKTSKWTNVGDRRMIVSAWDEGSNSEEDKILRILRSGVLKERFDFRVTIGRVVKVIIHDDNSNDVFERLRRLFGRLCLKELRLEGISMERPRLNKLNEFIDACFFDKLTMVYHAAIAKTGRSRELIDRARCEVVLETDEKIATLVKKHQRWNEVLRQTIASGVQSSPENPTYLDAALFLRRVRMGDDLVYFTTSINSVEALDYVITMVSKSRTDQKVDFVNQNFGVCKQYVDKVEALQKAAGYTPQRGAIVTESFIHKRATIHLAKLNRQPHDARIEVSGQGYPVYRFKGK